VVLDASCAAVDQFNALRFPIKVLFLYVAASAAASAKRLLRLPRPKSRALHGRATAISSSQWGMKKVESRALRAIMGASKRAPIPGPKTISASPLGVCLMLILKDSSILETSRGAPSMRSHVSRIPPASWQAWKCRSLIHRKLFRDSVHDQHRKAIISRPDQKMMERWSASFTRTACRRAGKRKALGNIGALSAALACSPRAIGISPFAARLVQVAIATDCFLPQACGLHHKSACKRATLTARHAACEGSPTWTTTIPASPWLP